MTRSMSGLLPVAAAVLLAACSDPTEAIRGGGDRVVTNPSVLVVDLNGSQTVDVQLLDEQGTPMAANFSPAPADPTVATAVQDTSFRPGLGANRLTQRFIVSGLSANATTINFAAGGQQFDLPVIVNPDGNSTIADLSSNALVLGEEVTITVSGNVALGPTTTVTFPDSVTGADLQAVTVGFTATTITVVPIPGAEGPATINNVGLAYAPNFTGITLTTGDAVDVPAVLDIPAVFSDANPDINEVITATAAGFKFLPNVVVQFNGVNQPVSAVAADSNSVTFRVANAGNGVVTFQNVVLDFLTSAGLSLPSVASLAPTATVINLTGTGAIVTAPSMGSIAVTGGEVAQVTSGGAFNPTGDCTGGPGGFNCHIFGITVSDAATLTVNATWNNASDIGIYFSDADNVDLQTSHGCDVHGDGAGNFESCTVDVPAAGTYYVQVVTYAPLYPPPNNVDATEFTVSVTGP